MAVSSIGSAGSSFGVVAGSRATAGSHRVVRGFDLSPGWSVDVGAFGTSTNIERKRHTAIAVSLRLNPTD